MSRGESTIKLQVNDRIHLTEIRPGDQPAFVQHLNDRDIYNYTLRIPCPYTAADADTFLAIVTEATAKHGHPIHFAIRNESEELIGGCGFDDLTYGHRAEIAYWLAKPFWGQGVMTEVVKATCSLAMVEWKLVRVVAHVFEGNLGSARVLEKNGFQLEGLLKKHHLKDGLFLDSRLYALVR